MQPNNLSPRIPVMPTLRLYPGFNPRTLPNPFARAMPALQLTVPNQPTISRMPAPAPATSTQSPTPFVIRRVTSRKCTHCNVRHIGGPYHCTVNKMRMRPFSTTNSSTQTGDYTCNTCEPSASTSTTPATTTPVASPNTTRTPPNSPSSLPAPFASPVHSTYSSIGPLSPHLTQTSPPSMTTSPPAALSPIIPTSSAEKPSVSNVGPVVKRYRDAVQNKRNNPGLNQEACLVGINNYSLTSFKDSRYIAELFIADNDKFLAIQQQQVQRNLKLLKTFNQICKEVLKEEAMKPAVRQAKRESLIF